MFYMIMGIKISSLMISEGYGMASDASFVIILLSLGGISAGLLFGKILKVFKNYTASVGLMILAVAMGILSQSQNLILTFIGGYLRGFGFKVFMPILIEKVNNSNFSNPTLATSLILVGFNLGIFVSPYVSVLIQFLIHTRHLPTLFIVNALAFIVLALVSVVFSWISKTSVKVTN